MAAIYLHLIFSTKDRVPYFRDDSLRRELHSYMGGITKTLECPPVQIGGVADHVHVLARFGRTTTVAEWVKEVKRVSTNWIQQRGPRWESFHWQAGYGVFSVSASRLEHAIAYIQNQEEHHRQRTFQEELRELLQRHRVEFDERYVWD